MALFQLCRRVLRLQASLPRATSSAVNRCSRSYCSKEETDEEVIGDEIKECGMPVAETDEEDPPNRHPETKYMKKTVFASPDKYYGPGIYKAILVGAVGQKPVERVFTNDISVVIFSLGTGGLRNNRKQLEGEQWESYAERSFTQWHRICVFKLGLLDAARKLTKGSNVYIEGSIETRVYSDAVTGAIKRVREICVRQCGRLHVID